MKTIYKCFTLLAAIVLLAGCIQEEIPEVKASVEITARMECDADTRTSLSGLENGMYYPLWSAGDEIAVYADDDKDPSKFTIKSGDGSTVATFSGSRQGSEYLAVYPYDIAGSYANDTLSVILPQTQKYVKDSFGLGAFPMLASGSSGEGLRFMNLCSVLKISLTGTAAVRNVTLTANDENTFLSGAASVVVENAGTDKDLLVMSAGASRSVVLETKGLEISEDSPADVFIVLPSQTYKDGLTIEVDTYTDTVSRVIESDIVFERSQIRAIKDFELDSEVPDIIPEAVPDNEIWYITKDATLLSVNSMICNANLVSNEYTGGKGVLKFDDSVLTINSEAFYDNTLTELYVPDCVERLCAAFLRGTSLKSFRVPKNLKMAQGKNECSPFVNNDELTSLTGYNISEDGKCLIVGDGLTAFVGIDLTEYTTPVGVTTIREYVFSEIKTLEKITISEGVVTIEDHAFLCNVETSRLKEVSLPKSLITIGDHVFLGCYDIERFTGECELITDDGYAILVRNYYMGLDAIIKYASGSGITSYTIPDGVGFIETNAFDSANNLTHIEIPASVVGFNGHPFEHSYNIQSLFGPNVLDDNRSLVVDGMLLYVAPKGLSQYTTPQAVSCIGYGALADKPELEDIVISDEVVSVGSLASCRPYEIPLGYILQDNPKLKTVTVSANMKILGMDPFGHVVESIPDNFETVYMRSPVPPIIGHNQPENIPLLFPNLTIYVPEGSLEAYKSSPDWSPYRGYFKGYNYTDLPENETYVSSDYSKDGAVVTLQAATKGDGIDIVLMGDAYSDRQIADGTYRTDMENLYNNLFTEEPYKSFKDHFNVYYVNVISATEGYEYGNTALDTYFGDGTLVGGSDNAAFEYALNAITEDEMDEALIIVAMNSDAYAGTCYMYYPESATGTYGSGPAVAYFPKGDNAETFAQLLHHEANGHGFAKLADEYAYEDYGAVPDANVTQTRDQQNSWGWWKNVDFTSDPEQVRWSYFLDDERYANEGLGVFEGGLTYWTGVWRPTENSIMRYNTGGFNAPSREAIYYRIHKLAYGDSWEYDYEDFVEYDVVNRSTSASAPQRARRNYVERPLEPTAAPVVVGKSWRDAE